MLKKVLAYILNCCDIYRTYFIFHIPVNTLRKSNVILWSYFGNLRKLLSANVDVT